MEGASGATHDNPNIFRPEPDVIMYLQEKIYRRQADLHIKVELTDVRDGQVLTAFLRWADGDLATLVQHLQRALNIDGSMDRYEPYFWLYWRGWAGCLDGEGLYGLPSITTALLDKIVQGVPLRGDDLRRLMIALEWAGADAAGEWGATDTWEDDTISPGHLGLRRKVSNYIEQRMVELHGPGYADAPTVR
jgi:hypothetical protein